MFTGGCGKRTTTTNAKEFIVEITATNVKVRGRLHDIKSVNFVFSCTIIYSSLHTIMELDKKTLSC
jgi:predicted MarR family transcription regulator